MSSTRSRRRTFTAQDKRNAEAVGNAIAVGVAALAAASPKTRTGIVIGAGVTLGVLALVKASRPRRRVRRVRSVQVQATASAPVRADAIGPALVVERRGTLAPEE